MNRANILAVADAIEHHKISGLGFNMQLTYAHRMIDRSGQGCGTTACIKGWANLLRLERDQILALDWSVKHDEIFSTEKAAFFLGISGWDAEVLFYPVGQQTPDGFDPWFAESRHAVKVLRHLAETGEVSWAAAVA